MWVRMLQTAAGPRLPHPTLFAGHVYELDDELAQSFLDGRYAERAEAPKSKSERPVEVAAVDAGSKAVDPGASTKANLIDQLTGGADKNDAGKDAADKKDGSDQDDDDSGDDKKDSGKKANGDDAKKSGKKASAEPAKK